MYTYIVGTCTQYACAKYNYVSQSKQTSQTFTSFLFMCSLMFRAKFVRLMLDSHNPHKIKLVLTIYELITRSIPVLSVLFLKIKITLYLLLTMYTCSSSDSSSGSYMYHDEVMDEEAPTTSKPKVPLDQEWVTMAKKMLKGADPEKTLTWRTAEVSR